MEIQFSLRIKKSPTPEGFQSTCERVSTGILAHLLSSERCDHGVIIADTSERSISVKLEGGFRSIMVTNTLVRQVQHKKELLGNSYVETLQRHCPCNISLHNVDKRLEKRLRPLCTAVESQHKKLKTRDKPPC